jgi:Calcineurin-like phosphoesterase
VAIVFADTTTLAPSLNKCCNENGGVSTDVQTARITNQLSHLESMLAQARSASPNWLFVTGHYPVFSVGEHGDTSELSTNLLPLLRKYEVDAYFCGHDHISEHLVKDGIHYFIAGGGSMTDYIGSVDKTSANPLWYGEGFSAFAAGVATRDCFTIAYIDADGKTKYSYTLYSKNPNAGSDITPPPPARIDPVATGEAMRKAIEVTGGILAAASLAIIGLVFFDGRGFKKLLKKRVFKPTKTLFQSSYRNYPMSSQDLTAFKYNHQRNDVRFPMRTKLSSTAGAADIQSMRVLVPTKDDRLFRDGGVSLEGLDKNKIEYLPHTEPNTDSSYEHFLTAVTADDKSDSQQVENRGQMFYELSRGGVVSPPASPLLRELSRWDVESLDPRAVERDDLQSILEHLTSSAGPSDSAFGKHSTAESHHLKNSRRRSKTVYF